MPDVSKPVSDYTRVKQLMQEIGSAKGFDPIPPDQHKWHMDPEGTTPLQRMWGWMIQHTVHWGHRSAYAINHDGHELHIEHAAKDLGMDLPNAYRTWRQGIARGIWRAGTPSEGTRRMHLTGKVPRYKAPDPSSPSPEPLSSLPAHIRKQVASWPAERVQELVKAVSQEDELEKHVQSALIAANRDVFMRRQQAIYQQFEIETKQQKHQKQQESEADAEARRARIDGIRTPIELYVQTISDFVQTAPKAPVQTTATLLESQSKSQSFSAPVGRRTMPRSPSRPSSQDGKKSINQLPAPQTTPLSAQEREAEQLIYSEIAALQRKYAHMDFSKEIISSKRKSDQLFAYRVIATVGAQNVSQFLIRVGHQLKNLDKNAFGKLPGRAPAPRSLGLISQWAQEYSERLTEAARIEQSEKEEWTRRQIKACREILDDRTETADAKFAARKWLEEWEQSKALHKAQSA